MNPFKGRMGTAGEDMRACRIAVYTKAQIQTDSQNPTLIKWGGRRRSVAFLPSICPRGFRLRSKLEHFYRYRPLRLRRLRQNPARAAPCGNAAWKIFASVSPAPRSSTNFFAAASTAALQRPSAVSFQIAFPVSARPLHKSVVAPWSDRGRRHGDVFFRLVPLFRVSIPCTCAIKAFSITLLLAANWSLMVATGGVVHLVTLACPADFRSRRA